MLSYISSTRKKSCFHCVKAKRRCDLGYPFCKRCFVKGIDCKYPNAEKASQDPVVIRQTTPDFNLPPKSNGTGNISTTVPSVLDTNDGSLGLQFVHYDYTGTSLTTGMGQPTESNESIESIKQIHFETIETPESSDLSDSGPPPQSNVGGDWMEVWRQDMLVLRKRMAANPRICGEIGPMKLAPCFIKQSQTSAIIKSFSSFIPELAYSGATQFLHHSLYRYNQPQAYQGCVAISGLFLTKNPMNQALIGNIINAKIAGLFATAKNWTLEEHLAAVQALIIYQFIRLFNPDLQLQEQAEKHNALLEHWTSHLWKRFYVEFQNSKDTFQHWVFNESARRTILMSVFTRCAWTCYTKDGLATQVPVLMRLPLTKDLQSWNCSPEDWNSRTLPFITEEENLFSYQDLMYSWTQDMPVESLGGFAKMLLSACRGGDDPRLLE